MVAVRKTLSSFLAFCREFLVAGLLITVTKRSLITYKNPCKWAVGLIVAAGVLLPSAAATTSRTTRTIDTIRLTLAFACIHTYEGSWTADTGNGYYGGLQMDSAFERAYGRALLRRYGHANHWPPAQQVAVAIRAFRSGRGFVPWPNTARKCGLL